MGSSGSGAGGGGGFDALNAMRVMGNALIGRDELSPGAGRRKSAPVPSRIPSSGTSAAAPAHAPSPPDDDAKPRGSWWASQQAVQAGLGGEGSALLRGAEDSAAPPSGGAGTQAKSAAAPAPALEMEDLGAPSAPSQV